MSTTATTTATTTAAADHGTVGDAGAQPDAITRGRTLCTFRLADLHLGVDVTRVQEVIRRQDVTRIPLVSPVLCGLINLRGEIVTAIDLRRRMALDPAAAEATSMNVIIRTKDGPVSLVVDAIDDVIDVDEDTFEPPPPTLHEARRALVAGVFKLEHDLLLVLDLERVLDPHDLLSAADEQTGAPSPAASPASPTQPGHSTRVPPFTHEVQP